MRAQARAETTSDPRLRLLPWLVLLAALDFGLTSVVLALGGREVNPVADGVLQRWGLGGMLALKVASVGVLAAVSLWLSRHEHSAAAQRLVAVAAAVTAVPVLVGAAQVARVSWSSVDDLSFGAATLGAGVTPQQAFELSPELSAREMARRLRKRQASGGDGDAAGAEQGAEALAEHEVVLGEADAAEVLVEVAEDELGPGEGES